MQKNKIHPTLSEYIDGLKPEFDRIDETRKALLQQLGQYIRDKTARGETARFTVICTHNSRRSHMGQLWLKAAAEHYGVHQIETYSGGTEATAFNPRAVEALRRAGFQIRQKDQTENPVYKATSGPGTEAMKMFSKKYDHPANPASGFAAILVCSEADAGCPFVPGAEQRFAITYEDPKHFDDRPEETSAYDERCRQIAREMFFALHYAK